MTTRQDSDFSDFSNGIRVLKAQDVRMGGWVLLFDRDTEKEGVYTLQDSKYVSVVTFEMFDHAHEFAKTLARQDFEMASPTHWDADILSYFCELRQYRVLVVPHGTTLKPPAQNTVSLDSHRERLDVLFEQTPDYCGDDDCGVV